MKETNQLKISIMNYGREFGRFTIPGPNTQFTS